MKLREAIRIVKKAQEDYMAKKTKGKGVDALFLEEQAEVKKQKRRERDAAARREKRRADREEREMAARLGPREVTAATHTESGAYADPPPASPKRPAPTLAALAQSFDDACARTEEKQAELDEALRQQAAAKQALDQAVSRRANGEHA